MANWKRHSESTWQFKAWPTPSPEMPLGEVVERRPNIFADGFLFPVPTISISALEHNITTVAQFCRDHGVSLAPHAKTTMSPEIVERQLAAGAWGMTAANASQARVLRQFGVKRILIAHQVVDPSAVRWIFDQLGGDPELQIVCLADSVDGIRAMELALVDSPEGREIDVLVELGYANGRTGCRTLEDAVAVARGVDESHRLRLLGVEGFEGMIPTRGGGYAAVDDFLQQIGQLAAQLDAQGLFAGLDEIILTAGGSMLPDRVVAVLGRDHALSKPTRLVLRSGCYVTHDSVYYADGAPFGVRAPMEASAPLRAALHVWSYVVSRPEPDLAILGFGKRDASFDVDLPRPLVLRRSGNVRSVDGELSVFALNDQHAYVRVEPGFDIAVGDIVGCGISHPCTTFDKWRAIPLVDDGFDVVGAIRTFF